jgi:hypothetical protein
MVIVTALGWAGPEGFTGQPQRFRGKDSEGVPPVRKDIRIGRL